MVSNVNLPNRGQMPQLPLGTIVETNCVFSNDQLCPVTARPLPAGAATLVSWNASNIDLCYEGIRQRDPELIFQSFLHQPLCAGLSPSDARTLFRQMCQNTASYLDPRFHIG